MLDVVSNHAVIQGSEESVAELRDSLIGLEDSFFDWFAFNEICPAPAALQELDYVGSAFTENRERYGVPTLRQWRARNWGTAFEPRHGFLEIDEPQLLYLNFLTSYTPPFEFYEYLECEKGLTVTAVAATLHGSVYHDFTEDLKHQVRLDFGLLEYRDGLDLFTLALIFWDGEDRVGHLPYEEATSEKIEQILKKFPHAEISPRFELSYSSLILP